MNHSIARSVAASIAVLSWSGVQAAPEPADEVIVTATRLPTPESQIASSVTVVSADAIDARQLQTLPDLLKEVPGLNIVQSGGPGGLTSIFMRGTNSNHTKVFVDGIDVADPSNSGGNFDFGQFLTQDIAKVEILRGPQSGLYGSDAIGGVINVITKSGSGPATVGVRVEGGSFNTFNQALSLSGSTDQFNYVATLQHFHSGTTPVTPLNLLVPGERRIDDYDDNVTASTKLRFTVSDALDFGMVGRYTNSHLRTTGDDFATFPSTPATAQNEFDTHQYYTRGTAHLVLFDGLFDQTLGLAYSNIKSFGSSPDGTTTNFFGDRVKIDWQGNLKLAVGETLVLGAEHQKDAISDPISADILVNSGYLELQSALADSFFNTVSVRLDDNDRYGTKVTYRIAPAYLIQATGTKLKASIGTGFKAPTLSELFQNFPDFGFFANPALKPETSLGFDLGFEQQVGGNVQFGATYFRNHIKNLIAATFTSYANIGRAQTDGVEAFFAYQPLSSLDLRADYTYTQAFDEVLNLELLRRPKHKASVTAHWQATNKLSFSPDLLYIGAWIDGNRDFSIPRLTAGSYVVANFAVNYDLTTRMSLFARVTNLAGHHYENPVGFLQPSRGAFAGVKAKF